MHMGLSGSPITFQRMMNHILSDLIGTACMVYIDDIIIFGKDETEHDKNLERVLQRLRTHGIRIKPKKCKIAFTKLQFMGYVISGE